MLGNIQKMTSLHIDMMVQACWLLGQATAKVGEPPDLSHIEEARWKDAYMRGFEREKRRQRAAKNDPRRA